MSWPKSCHLSLGSFIITPTTITIIIIIVIILLLIIIITIKMS